MSCSAGKFTRLATLTTRVAGGAELARAGLSIWELNAAQTQASAPFRALQDERTWSLARGLSREGRPVGNFDYHALARAPAGHLFMLGWTITFLVVAIIAGLLGFTGIAGGAAAIAKILFFLFLVLFVISLVTGRRASKI